MTLSALLHSPPPQLGLSIDAGLVACARVTPGGGRLTISAHAVQRLPPGAVVPSLAGTNIADPTATSAAVRGAVEALGGTSRRAALVLPDAAAKVSLVRLETVPARAHDLRELLRWHMRKSAPFPIEQARVSYTAGTKTPGGGQEFVVCLARHDVVAQYEQTCEAAGLRVGLVDLASFSIINAAVASQPASTGDWLLVSVAASSTTLVVLREGQLIFYRNRSEAGEGTLADLVHQTSMYYEDRLQGQGFERVLLAGSSSMPAQAGASVQNLAERLRVPVTAFTSRAAVQFAGADPTPDVLDALTPLAGVLLREARAA